MKLISWNINGLRAGIKKGLADFVHKEQADAYCFQEIKMIDRDVSGQLLPIIDVDGYEPYWCLGKRPGYSGVMTLSRVKPLSVFCGMNHGSSDEEGRVLTLEFEDYYLINTYFPNSNRELSRLDFKLEFNKKFEAFCKRMSKKKPLVICGDLNVAHTELDIARPKQNEGSAGFTPQERVWMTKFLKQGYLDTFRMFVKDGGHYTWWAAFTHARERNVGWRIDYFVVSPELKSRVKESSIQPEVMGSDHCPVRLVLK